MSRISVVLLFVTTACVSMIRPRTLTPAELAQHEQRVYSASVAIGMQAATVALRSLGFEITMSDATTGMIKTAPRDIGSSAVAGGGAAVSFRDELAWVVTVTQQANTIRVRAVPHAYTNGNEVDPAQVPADAIEPKFTALWNELDQDMKQVAAQASNP
jgi:hypothetical protein